MIKENLFETFTKVYQATVFYFLTTRLEVFVFCEYLLFSWPATRVLGSRLQEVLGARAGKRTDSSIRCDSMSTMSKI